MTVAAIRPIVPLWGRRASPQIWGPSGSAGAGLLLGRRLRVGDPRIRDEGDGVHQPRGAVHAAVRGELPAGDLSGLLLDIVAVSGVARGAPRLVVAEVDRER